MTSFTQSLLPFPKWANVEPHNWKNMLGFILKNLTLREKDVFFLKKKNIELLSMKYLFFLL